MIASVVLALVPIGLLIALGAGLRRTGFLGQTFWPQAEHLSYYVLLPALFVHGLATAHLDGVPVFAFAVVLIVSTCTVAVALLAAHRRLGFRGPAFTSVFQGGIRFNNYVGVSATIGVFGAQGVALAAVANAAIVPTVNILCVLVFARFGTGGRPRPAAILRQLGLNPLVVACCGGILLQATGLGLPPGLEPMLKALGQASLPLGLLCVGAALDLSAARTWMRPVLVASGIKFLVMPVVTVLACRALGLHGPAAATALIFQVLPTASSSFIMARQLGGDAPLMAGIIAAQTMLAGLAIPLVLLSLQGIAV
jgi:predicted permease